MPPTQLKKLKTASDPLIQLLKVPTFATVLSLGVVLLITLDILMVSSFHKDEKARQALIAEKLQSQIHSSIEEHIATLVSLNVVYQNFVDINTYDFQQYGSSITSHLSGFRRLFFIDPNYVIRQAYPLNEQSEALFGMSVKNEPNITVFLNRAKTSKKQAASGIITFFDHKKTLLAAIPIYRNNQEFVGFAMGEIDMERIWQPLNQSSFMLNYKVQILDQHNVQLLERDKINSFDALKVSSIMTSSDLDSLSENVAKVHFQVADQKWTLLLEPNYPIQPMFFRQIAFWFGGLTLLSLILLLVARNTTHKNAFSEAQKQFEVIFKASPDGIALLDNSLHFQLANPALQKWVDKPIEDLHQKTFFDLFTCQCPHLGKCKELSVMLCTSAQFQEELPETLEVDINDRDVNLPPLRLRFNASRIDKKQAGTEVIQGNYICLLGDITATKELEREKETYVATLTHDLKTPLLAQEMVLDSMLSGSTGNISPTQEKLLSASKQSVQDLLEMVNDSLLFYKIESSRLTIQKNPYALPPLIKEVLERLKPLAEQRNLTFELESAPDFPDAWIDLLQMKRVLHNVLSNAISYAARGTVIRVSLSCESDDRLIIEIKNEGKGILPNELPRIFDKYYSLSRKFKQIGTGLGLYISRRIVELHGGKIWALSEPDKETRFFIALPYPRQVG